MSTPENSKKAPSEFDLVRRMRTRAWWEAHRDLADFEWEKKAPNLAPLLKLADEQGMIGAVVLDVGSGRKPLSALVKKEGRKIITLDFNAPDEPSDSAHIKADVRSINDPFSLEKARALTQAAKLLGIDIHVSAPEQIDTMIFSDIFNYMPYKETLRSFSKYLKPGGTIIILNKPDRRFDDGWHLMDPDGPLGTAEMMDFLQEIGFKIEMQVPISGDFTPMKKVEPPDDQIMMFAIFRKKK